MTCCNEFADKESRVCGCSECLVSRLRTANCLFEMGLPSAREVHAMRDGNRIRYAGLVICRQQPATARGAVFMTLEDETGFVNLVLWKDVFAKHRVVARTAGFLGITGKVQSESGVVNLVAEELWVPRLEALPPEAGSRDSH